MPWPLGFYKDIVNQDISFFELIYYMFPVGWLMTFLLWGFFMVFFKPEKRPHSRSEGKSQAAQLRNWARITRKEIIAAVIVFGCYPGHVPAILYPGFEAGRQDRHHPDFHHPVLYHRHPGPGGSGRDPLEHHPAVRRRHEHRFLPVGNRGRQVDGRQLAGHVQGVPTGSSLSWASPFSS